MNPFEFVLMLVMILAVTGVIRAKMGLPPLRGPGRFDRQGLLPDQGDPLETERLRDEMLRLKERVQVLERIATDKEDTLTRQIDSLRDR